MLIPTILNNAREEAKGRKKTFLSPRTLLMSGGGEKEMRTTPADISHVDKQIQGLSCPFFQCIHGLLMEEEFRRMEERKMERGRLGDWKKEVKNSMAGDHGAVQLLLQGTLLFDP